MIWSIMLGLVKLSIPGLGSVMFYYAWLSETPFIINLCDDRTFTSPDIIDHDTP